MNFAALAFFVVGAWALLTVPRKWAPVPLLISCCYMTIGQGLELGPVSLPLYRMILAVGLLRVVVKGERLAGGINTIDKLMFAWGTWVLIASFFHQWAPGSGPVYASGFVFNISLVYFLIRIWSRDLDELMDVTRIVALLLAPIALAMLAEHLYERNVFAVFGGVPEGVYFRDGKIRAQGPFQHPILAGTVGAVCFPLMIGIWHRHRRDAIIGVAACLGIVLTSSSSSPAMSLIIGIWAVAMWRYRQWVWAGWVAFIGIYLTLELLMNRPAYYLISMVDLTGSSTGWHRSRLIEAAIEYFGEWWLYGTDRTVHWMGVGLSVAEQHSDITNYFIWIGIIGGFPALLLMIAMMWRAFRSVGTIVRKEAGYDGFMVWCLGAGLFAHAATSLAVSYHDQSMIFFWLNLAVISSMHSIHAVERTSRIAQPGPPPTAPKRETINPAWRPRAGMTTPAPVRRAIVGRR